MDINQNQQTNTFLKGMNTDTSDMLLGSDQYRYAENVRIVTDTDSNSGELRLIEGTTQLHNFGEGELIVAVDSIRDIVVVIFVRQAEDGSLEWSVCRLDDPTNIIFGPCTEKIWIPVYNNDKKDVTTVNDIRKSITTVMRYESPNNIKLYIADSTGKHSIMVLNVAKGHELGNVPFDLAFAYQRTLLPPAEISISAGSGSIMSGRVQYAYRLYSKNKPATPLSILSSVLSLYRNEYSGYEAEKKSGRAVDIKLPNGINTNGMDFIQVYRISYSVSGQLPKVSLVKDEKITNNMTDIGTDIMEMGMSEFLSMFTPFIYPKILESKGDYLFAANMKYSLDEVDTQFEDFDAIAYSAGSRYDGQEVDPANIPLKIDLSKLTHEAFVPGLTPTYNPEHWAADLTTGANGWGKYISWKYDDKEINLSPNNLGSIYNHDSTFRCGETYRFGIRLYDQYGRASSVKWIADIIIPNRANITSNTDISDAKVKFKNIGIKFFKTTGSKWPDNISGWEIVRCERTLTDRKTITQGLVGVPLELYMTEGKLEQFTRDDYRNKADSGTATNLLCNPGFFSTDFFAVYNKSINNKYSLSIPATNTLMFASPESCYQDDDVYDILKANNSSLLILAVYGFTPNSIEDSYIFKWREKNDQTGVYEDKSLKWAVSYAKQSANGEMSFPFTIPDNEDTLDTYEYQINSALVFLLIENYPLDDDDEKRYLTSGTRRGSQKIYTDNTRTRTYFNYFTPKYSAMVTYPTATAKINSVANVKAPEYSDFANEEVWTFKNNTNTIGNKQFINWSWPLMLNVTGEDERDIKGMIDNIDYGGIIPYDNEYEPEYERARAIYPIGAGGKLMLFDITTTSDLKWITYGSKYNIPSITVANVTKEAIPYGGYNKTAIDNSSYLSFGDYTTRENDSIRVFSGDTKNRIFTYNALHTWYDPTYKNCVKMATVYAIPVETDIDIQAQYGLLYGVDNFSNYNAQDVACAFDNYTLNKDAYMYNPAYNATPDIVTWTTPEVLETKLDGFDTRVHYSNVKTNNEDIDSWTLFQAANYIDVDSRHGEITDMKLFKYRLIFWQENATGMLAVNERVVLNDQNDAQVVLGTGGVLERYDYFTTIYGLKKNQHARTVSNDSLYWWDGNNKEILVHQQKYDVAPLSTIKGIKNYLNKYDETATPELAYDNKYKEVIASVVNKGSVVFNEQIQSFTGVYTFTPLYDALLNGKLLLTSDNTVYTYNAKLNNNSKLFDSNAYPLIQYVVNNNSTYVKTFDILTFGGRFYGGDNLSDIKFKYKTPLKQEARATGNDLTLTNREYDFRLNVPRAGYETENEKEETVWKTEDYGDRMKGKTMQCELKSDSNDIDFSLQYITTKFRMSWT